MLNALPLTGQIKRTVKVVILRKTSCSGYIDAMHVISCTQQKDLPRVQLTGTFMMVIWESVYQKMNRAGNNLHEASPAKKRS
jgi:hypothetical protein